MDKIVRATAIVFCSLFIWTVAQSVAPPAVEADPSKEGTDLFEKQCAICHGSDGKGDGRAAVFLFPKPRNFTDGLFKIRTTPGGSPPTKQDIFNTITNGMPGSAMPGFASLPESQRWALAALVAEWAEIEEEPEEVIQVSAEPPATAEIVGQGKELYIKNKCWECHGHEGRGDGPASGTHIDDWGYPILTNDLTRGIFKGGHQPSDIYVRLTSGLAGTPMPAYEDVLSDAERWALAHYVKSLVGSKVAEQPSTGTIVAGQIAGPLPSNALDSRWGEIAQTTVPLMQLWQTKQAVDAVSVKAVHDRKRVVILVEWEDWEINSSTLRHEDFSDGAAIMFSLAPKKAPSEQPHFSMGEKGEAVNLWYWRLDRQMDLAGHQDIETIYPHMVSDSYQLERGRYPLDVNTPSHLPMASATAHDPVFITGWGAGNPVSNPVRSSAAEDLNAEGFGTLTAQPQADQNVEAYGLYVAGKWMVVFARELRSEGSSDVQFKNGRAFPLAFAVWDGSKQDRDGQKAVTSWYELMLE